MNDYFKSLQIDSSALTAEEIQMINDWDQKHKHGERSISLRSAETQEEFNAFYAENKSVSYGRMKKVIMPESVQMA